MGLSMMPAPFDRMIAIASDCDSSSPEIATSYTAKLVNGANFDFGDSAHFYNLIFHHSGQGYAEGCDIVDKLTEEGRPAPSDQLLDVVRLYHQGLVDHLHGPLQNGGSWVVSSAVRVKQGGLEIEWSADVSDEEWPDTATCHMRYLALQYDAGIGPAQAPRRFSVEIDAKKHCFSFDRWLDRDHLAVYSCNPTMVPRSTPLFSIKVPWSDDTPSPRRVFMGSFGLRDFFNHYCEVRAHYGLEFNSVTAHSGYLFYNQKSKEFHQGKTKTNEKHDFDSIYSTFEDDVVGQDRFSVSMLADDVGSNNYVSTADLIDQGIRFINPAGATGAWDRYFPIDRQLVPAATRDDAQIYAFRRSLPRVPEPESSPSYDPELADITRTRRLNFRLRLLRMLEQMPKNHASVLYTHLGVINDLDDPEKAPLVKDFLDRERYDDLNSDVGLATTSRSVFGIPRSAITRALAVLGITPKPKPQREILRTAITRLSVLNRYLWMFNHVLRQCPVQHRGEETICHVRDFHDTTLGRDVEVNAELCYGLSIAVSESARFELFYNDRSSREYVVIVDGDGQKFAKICGLGIRCSLLPYLLPDDGVLRIGNTQGELHYDISEFRRTSNAVGKLSVNGKSRMTQALGTIDILPGASYFVIDVAKTSCPLKFILRWKDGRKFRELNILQNELFENPRALESEGMIYVPIYCLISFFDSVKAFKDAEFELLVINPNSNLGEVFIRDIFLGKPHYTAHPADSRIFIPGQLKDPSLFSRDIALEFMDEEGNSAAAQMGTGGQFFVGLAKRGVYTARSKDGRINKKLCLDYTTTIVI
ncbi:MAG: hypothetical protein ACI8XZ_004983 [Gammaproteobacteria bacterium]|jgi:hypothetical protein